MAKPSHALWVLLLALACGCGSGEAATDDFGAGYKGGSQPPLPTQRGESTPTPNLSECPECSNVCLQCIENAGEDENASLLCLIGPECTTYFAAYIDTIPEYGVADDNILDTPSGEQPSDQCAEVTDPCLACECFFGPGAEECIEC